MKGISESLAGRLIPLEFMPLSIYERTGHGLGQTPYLPSPVLVSKLRIPDTNEAWRFIYLLRRLSKSAKSTARLLTFLRSEHSWISPLRSVRRPTVLSIPTAPFSFQHSTFVLGEVCRLDPSGFSRLDRLRLRRPCLLPLLWAPCGRLSGF